mgnify:CR=1 FL=1
MEFLRISEFAKVAFGNPLRPALAIAAFEAIRILEWGADMVPAQVFRADRVAVADFGRPTLPLTIFPGRGTMWP